MSTGKSRALAAAALASGLGACATQSQLNGAAVDAAIREARANTLPATPEEIAAAERADPLTRANFWSKEYEKNPANLDTSIAFASALREIGSHQRAIEVTTQTLILHPESDDLLVLLGQSLMSAGHNNEASEVLLRATAINPLNADAFASRGLALDRQERHRDAQRSYMRALALDPGRIATRSNYAMSLTLSGELPGAEAALRQALNGAGAENIRIRENLALVLGLQGKFDALRRLKANNAPVKATLENEALLRGMVGAPGEEPAIVETAPEAAIEETPSLPPLSSSEAMGSLEQISEANLSKKKRLKYAKTENVFRASLSGARLPNDGGPMELRGFLLR